MGGELDQRQHVGTMGSFAPLPDGDFNFSLPVRRALNSGERGPWVSIAYPVEPTYRD